MKQKLFRKVVGLSWAFMLLASLLFGTLPAHAAAGNIYLSPSSKSVTKDTNFSVQVKVDTGSEQANTASVKLNYDTAKLQVVGSISYSGSAFDSSAGPDSSSGGVIASERFTFTPKSGNLLIFTVSFKAIATGTAAVTFVTSDTAVPSVSTNDNIVTSHTNGSYTISNPVAPKPTPKPTTKPTTGTTTDTTPKPTTTTGGTTSKPKTNEPAPTPTKSETPVATNEQTPVVESGKSGVRGIATTISDFYKNNTAWVFAAIGLVIALFVVSKLRRPKFGIHPSAHELYAGGIPKPKARSVDLDPQSSANGQPTGAKVGEMLNKVESKQHKPGDLIQPQTLQNGNDNVNINVKDKHEG